MRKVWNKVTWRNLAGSFILALIFIIFTIYFSDLSDQFDCVILQFQLCSKMTILGIIIPIQLYGVFKSIENNYELSIILRYGSLEEWWKQQTGITLKVSVIESLLIQSVIGITSIFLYEYIGIKEAVLYGIFCCTAYMLILFLCGLLTQWLILVVSHKIIAWLVPCLLISIPTILTTTYHWSWLPDIAAFCNFGTEYEAAGTICSIKHIVKLLDLAIIASTVYYIVKKRIRRRDLL